MNSSPSSKASDYVQSHEQGSPRRRGPSAPTAHNRRLGRIGDVADELGAGPVGGEVSLQRRIVKHKDSILAAIEHGLSNGRIESVNTKIRLITRVAFGFASPDALIALAMLTLGGHPPALPNRK